MISTRAGETGKLSFMTSDDFASFVFAHLPPPPGPVLEVGCGEDGGLVPELRARGYEAYGVDPLAPAGDEYLGRPFQEAAETLVKVDWLAVVAGRVLHHVNPLEGSLDLLVELAPLLLVDEFDPDLVSGEAQEWYEQQHRQLRESGAEPHGPADLDDWRAHHPGLHPHERLLGALRDRYEERTVEWLPYFHRWLRSPASERAEREAVAAGTIPAVGYRFVGVRRKGPSDDDPLG